MALSPIYEITPVDGGQTVTASNETTYGGANQDRDEAAEYVLWSKTDKNSVRSFYNPDQGDVLNNLEYILSTVTDGWYELIRLRIQFYDAGANYVPEIANGGVISQYASVFYYPTTGKVYKAIDNSTNQDPQDANYFVEVPEDELYTLINNTNLEAFFHNYAHNYSTETGLRDRFMDVMCCTSEDRERNQTLLYKKQSADTNFTNGYPDRYEKIIRDIELELQQAA